MAPSVLHPSVESAVVLRPSPSKFTRDQIRRWLIGQGQSERSTRESGRSLAMVGRGISMTCMAQLLFPNVARQGELLVAMIPPRAPGGSRAAE